MMARLPPLLPALLPPVLVPPALVLLFAAFCGTWTGGATAAGSLATVLLVLAAGLGGAARWRDPLGLGRAGRLLPWALLVLVAASWWASPVRRAGLLAVLLLPAFLLLPAAVARWWAVARWRQVGLELLAAVVAGVGAWALVEQQRLDLERAALPLGHHNLLAAWLVTLLPLAVLPALAPGLRGRLLAALAALFGLAALVATGSWLGLVALAVELALAALWLLHRGRQRATARLPARLPGRLAVQLVLLLGLAVTLALPRGLAIVRGTDPSLKARETYWQAGWRGMVARPALGWGPGSVPWTAPYFLRPVPGVNPPGELVGHLHGLPVQLAYEVGLPGLLLAGGLGLLFLRRRLEAGHGGEDGLPALRTAGLLGLGGFAVTSLGGGELFVTALPVAAAVAAGAALAEEERPAASSYGLGYGLYTVLALLLLQAPLRAQFAYEAARRAEAEGLPSLPSLERSVALDPAFPLYRFRLAARQAEAREALRAAEDGAGVAALWLRAGLLGQDAAALEKACRLDPLSALPAFARMRLEAGESAAAYLGARALLVEPRLAAACAWGQRPALLPAAAARVAAWQGVEEGWRVALLEAVGGAAGPVEAAAPAQPLALALSLDADPALSLSLHLFRRTPWPETLAEVLLDPPSEDLLALPSAAVLATTRAAALSPETCALPP